MKFRGAWVLPISQPPVRDGWVRVQHGRIAGVGSGADAAPSDEIDLGYEWQVIGRGGRFGMRHDFA